MDNTFNQNKFNGGGSNRSSIVDHNQKEDYSVTNESGIKLSFKDAWITEEADQEMIDYSKSAGNNLSSKGLSTSKLRNIYDEIKRIQVDGYEKEKRSFLLLQPKVAYAVAREESKSKPAMKIFQNIFERAASCVSDGRTYENFCNLMEAIVAYHKFFENEKKSK